MAQTSARELLANVANIKRGERLLTLLMFLWFFITLSAYYVIRPVRSALVLGDYPPTILPWIYMGTAVVTGVVVYVYGKLASLPRKKLIGGVLLFFAAAFVAWWWIAGRAETARAVDPNAYAWTSPVFYVWVDVYSIMAVTIFWMYANDVFPPRSAKRIFGVIGAAGPLGGLTGAFLTSRLVEGLGTVNMVLVAAGIYLLAFGIFLGLELLTGGKSADRGAAAARFEEKQANLSELPAVLRLIRSSRFLLLLTLVVCFERMVPDFADYVWQATLDGTFADEDQLAQFFATVEFWRNAIAFVATLFFTAAILNLLGVKFGLSSVPATILVFALLFALTPVLLFAVLLKNVEEGQRHTWFKAAKETTYTVTSREVIYRVKGYIEMFFYRLSRGIAGVILLGITTIAGLGTTAVAMAAVPLALVWLWSAWSLGKEYEALEAQAEARAPAGAAQPEPVR
ncbi:MAG: NTP/NDP exchange transporter [Gemmatimonadota bacterium]